MFRRNFATAWMNLGIVEAALRNPTAAESHYKTALRMRPNSADTYFNLGNLYLSEKRYSEAKSAWLNATSLYPRHSKAWTNLIILADDLGDLLEAEILGRKALHEVPNSPQLHFALANCLGKLEKFPEAELEFQLAIAGDPENAQVFANLGVLYHRWGKHRQAADAYRSALRFNPELGHLHKYLSQLQAFIVT